jgi:hypothetical protein
VTVSAGSEDDVKSASQALCRYLARQPSRHPPEPVRVCPVSNPRKRDTLGAVLAIGAAIAGLVGIAWLPFAFGPGAVIVVLAAALMSRTNTMLIRVATFTVGVSFVIGAALAVASSRALY